MSCLIIEDDFKVVSTIQDVGYEFYKSNIDFVSEHTDNALDAIFKTKPNVVMVNFDSSKMCIPDLFFEAHQCLTKVPTFIALSSSKTKAFDAYKYDCSDFILKPLKSKALRKILHKLNKQKSLQPTQTICLKSYRDYQYLNLNEILFLKADNNTTDFYMIDGSVISAFKTLKLYEEQMPSGFLRIHKSYIINKDYVSRIQYGKSTCIINNAYKIPFTKTFISNVDLINSSLSVNTLALN